MDAVRDALALLEADEVGDLLDSIVEKTYRNAVFRSGTIGGNTAAAVAGVELFSLSLIHISIISQGNASIRKRWRKR